MQNSKWYGVKIGFHGLRKSFRESQKDLDIDSPTGLRSIVLEANQIFNSQKTEKLPSWIKGPQDDNNQI